MERAILEALDAVERETGILVLFAAESGSRAWGFPSPDSDWDVRFVYARPTQDYLRVSLPRDVIERPGLPGDLDLSGWDLRKALGLILRGNCAIREWLASPTVYMDRKGTMADLAGLVSMVQDRASALHHYTALAKQVRGRWLCRDPMPAKKYLYAARPALVLEWLRQHPQGLPPMDVPTLLGSVTLAPAQHMAIIDLIRRKREMPEMGECGPDPVLDAMIGSSLEWAEEHRRKDPRQEPSREARDKADAMLRYGAFAAACVLRRR